MQVTRIIPDVPSFLANALSQDTWSILFMVGQSIVIFLAVAALLEARLFVEKTA